MYLYFILCFSVLLIGGISSLLRGYNFSNIFFIVLISIACSILPGLRNFSVGTDTEMYVNMLQWDKSYSEWIVSGLELGYVTYIKLLGFMGVVDYSLYFLILAIIFNYLVVNSIYKLKYSIVVCLLSFLTFSFAYLCHFNVLRQSMALAFFIATFPYLFKGNNVKVYLLLLLAVGFHYSAIVLFLIPFLYNLIKKSFFITTLFSVVFFILYSLFANKFIELLIFLSGSNKYTYYTDKVSNFDSPYLFFVYFLIWIFSAMFYLNINLKNNNEYKFFFFLQTMHLTLMFCITFLGLDYEGPGRLLIYFSVAHIFIFSFYVRLFSSEQKILVGLIISSFMISFFLVLVMAFNLHGVFPYKFSNQIF